MSMLGRNHHVEKMKAEAEALHNPLEPVYFFMCPDGIYQLIKLDFKEVAKLDPTAVGIPVYYWHHPDDDAELYTWPKPCAGRLYVAMEIVP